MEDAGKKGERFLCGWKMKDVVWKILIHDLKIFRPSFGIATITSTTITILPREPLNQNYAFDVACCVRLCTNNIARANR